MEELKEALDAKGFVLIPGKVMKKLLIQYGASEEDLAVLESGYIHKRLPVDQLPAMQHRQVGVSLFKKIIQKCPISDCLSSRAPEHDRRHDIPRKHPRGHPAPPHGDCLGGGGRRQDCLQKVKIKVIHLEEEVISTIRI